MIVHTNKGIFMNNKLTKLEKQWVLYDVGNSAFTLLVATIVPIYFNSISSAAGLAEVDYLAYWGYSASISTLIVAFLGPVLGTMADNKGFKKIIFTVAMLIGAVGLSVLWVPKSWQVFLGLFIFAKVGYSCSLIFYDSMLADVTTPERMDVVSSNGYAWGYIGSCIPFLVSLVIVLMNESLGISMSTAMMLAFVINALWWIGCTLPLLKNYKQIHYATERPKNVVATTFKTLGGTFKKIMSQKKILLFLIAFFFYIDGVYTIIDMATAYGSALGLDTTGLLLALLVTQIVAFPSALTIAKLSKTVEASKLIKISIMAYTAIALFAVQLDKQWEFWLLAVCVGLFQGGIQALSRSYFAQIIPADNSGEYFGIYDICGKGASFMGTALVSFTAQMLGNANGAIAIIAVMFVIGYFFFNKSLKA